MNTYQYSNILALNIIANLRIIVQHWTRSGSSWLQLDSSCHASAARPDSKPLGPAGLCATLNLKSNRPGLLWAALDSPGPALGRT